MRLSRQGLEAEAAITGFRPDVLEKVFLLLDLLEAINRHPDLSGKLALKGGTALNLFVFNAPRLSIDIDLNYIGAEDRSAMLRERPVIENAIALLARRLGLTPQTPKKEHAGMSWPFRYASVLGQMDNIKVDINYLYRVPLWPPLQRQSRPVGSRQARDILLLDDYELAAGKLAALFARRTSRDLFDAHELLVGLKLGGEKLRLAFVLYGAMNIQDWRKVSVSDIDRAAQDLDSYLLPLLRSEVVPAFGGGGPSATWGKQLAEECRSALAAVLPLHDNERLVVDRLLSDGELEPEHLTNDEEFARRVRRHPALLWKQLNVRKHFKLDN